MHIVLIECNPFLPASTPISLGYLAALLKHHGHRVQILNIAQDTPLSRASFASMLLDVKPKLIGFSAYQRNIFYVLGWARCIKSILPQSYIVIGGPQATFLPKEALHELDAIDFVCRAEGEVTILSLVTAIEQEAPLVDLEGLMGRDPQEATRLWEGNQPRVASDLDQYPSPYLDGTLVPIKGKDAILLASRGCPYECIFCYTPKAFGRKVRYHSVERVVQEIEWLRRQGVDSFWFADPSFTMHQERVHRLFDALLSKDIKGRIWIETRADLVSKELLEKMKRVGVSTIAYGLEAVSGEVLRLIKKRVDLAQLEEAIRHTQELDIDVELFSQYGLPGQDYTSAMQTLAFVKRMDVKIRGNTNAQQMQIYFGTEICTNYNMYGIRPIEPSVYHCLSIGSRYETEWLTSEQMRCIHHEWHKASLDGGTRIVS